MTCRQFLNVRHADVGRVTTHMGHFLLTHCPSVTIQETVHRSIDSVIEYKWHISGNDNISCYISTEDLLPIKSLGNPIRLPNQWSKSGYGTRYLATSEFGTAFDLSSWCIPSSTRITKNFFTTLRPIKSLLAISDLLLPFIATRGKHLGTSTLAVLPNMSPDPRGTWLTQHYLKKLDGTRTRLVAGIGWWHGLRLSWTRYAKFFLTHVFKQKQKVYFC